MTVAIGLTKGLTALVDDADADLAQFGWTASQGYAVRGTRPTRIFMHRLVLERILGRPIPHRQEPDHINGDRADNRRANLRAVTRSRNIANSTRPRGCSGLRGVRRMRQEWQAQITVDGHYTYLGQFKSREEAARVYNCAALQAWGEYAHLNDV